jgi:hypothetical protein
MPGSHFSSALGRPQVGSFPISGGGKPLQGLSPNSTFSPLMPARQDQPPDIDLQPKRSSFA